MAHVSSTIFIRFTSNFTRNLPFCIMHGSGNFSTKNEAFCSRAYSLRKHQRSFKDPAYSSGKCHVETRNTCCYSSVETAGFVIYATANNSCCINKIPVQPSYNGRIKKKETTRLFLKTCITMVIFQIFL